MKNIAKDVMFLKSVLNPEKKRYEIAVTNAQFAQTTGAAVTGSMLTQTTLWSGITQGASSAQRNGNSIKVNSLIFKCRLYQQSVTSGPIKYRIVIFTCKGAPQTTGNIALNNAFWEPNAFTGVVDYNSDRNPDQYMDFQILGQRSGTVIGDTVAGQTQIKDVSMPIKCSKHMRWDNAGALQEFPVYIYATADTGDTSSNTGLNMQYALKCYFYDN
jgi:hypothetical protein